MELKILHLSDTHGVHSRLRNLPEADILVHSGDFTMSGSEAETLDYNGPQKLDTELRQIDSKLCCRIWDNSSINLQIIRD